VGHITADQHDAYEERFSLVLLFPRYWLISYTVLMSGFGIVIVIVIGLMQYAKLPSNPFDVYADVFPGQPIHALNAHEPQCWRDYSLDSSTRCNLTQKTGVFTDVTVTYTGDLIHQISFTVRDGVLKVGDLAVFLEAARFQAYRSLVFSWHGNVGLAEIDNRTEDFSLLQYVWQVTLTETRLIRP
jgi:hypothetical protein